MISGTQFDAKGEADAELVDRLRAIGLEDREARVYVHLSCRGPARASDTAAAVRLKRTETYRTLEALMKRGFVTAHLARPVVYEAVSPEAVFNDLIAHAEERRAEIERLKDRVVDVVAASRRAVDTDAARHSYRIIQGRRPIHAAVETILRGAQLTQSMVSTTLTAAQASAQNRPFQTTLRRAAEGLPMRMLLRETSGLEHALQPLLAHRNVRVRFFEPTHPLRFTLVDEREIVMWLVSDPSTMLDAREDVAMWTNATDFVRSQQTLYDALWERAREVVRRPS